MFLFIVKLPAKRSQQDLNLSAPEGDPRAAIHDLRFPGLRPLIFGGRLLICDISSHRIRRVDIQRNQIDTFAGTGERVPTAIAPRFKLHF